MKQVEAGVQGRFVARAIAHGVPVHHAPDEGAALFVLLSITRELDGKTVALASDLGDLRGKLAEELSKAGVEALIGGNARELARADVGISRVRMGIAETASLVVAGNDPVDRLATMLPSVHVAVLEARTIVSSLDDAVPFLREAARGGDKCRPQYISLVTGASRTADIEKVLTIGVQGPRELRIVLVSGEGRSTDR